MNATTDPQTAQAAARGSGVGAADPDGPARLFALVVGTALVIGGIAGFFYESGFETGAGLVADDILGIFPTSGWDNVAHLLAGVAGLALASRAPRSYALAVGVVFAVIGAWGLLVTDRGVGTILDTFPVNGEDNVLHLAIGLCGLAAAFVSLER